MRLGDTEPDQHSGQMGDPAPMSAAALVEALAAERRARLKAESADQAKSELLALVSHELRTPMGAVIAMAELLLAGSLDDNQRRYAETLHQSARSLLSVLNDILDFSKLEAGHFVLDKAPFDLCALLADVASGLNVRTKEKGLEGRMEIAVECPDRVIGDAGRLRQILTNLVDNAVKFTHRGAVELTVKPALLDGKAAFKFEIVDTGIGLNDEERQRLFQPYVQIDRKIATQYGGTGLGLSIVRRLAELMGGEIGCESTPGEGSRFWVVLPMEPAPQENPRRAGSEERHAPTGSLNGTVLVVEDNAVNRMLIGAYLSEFGVQHEMAAGGEEALELLGQRPFDLVLMDIMMPGLDGMETTRRIRALPGALGDMPIVALTANAMKGDRETYLAAGMDGYVSKPIRGRELYDRIADFLTGREGGGGAMRRG